MLIKINLSSRPFYNRLFIYSLYVVLISTTVVFSLYNGIYLGEYLIKSNALKKIIDRQKVKLQMADSTITSVFQLIKQMRLKEQDREIGFANSLISQRTFSWSNMLNNFERLLPAQVMMFSISPQMQKGNIKIEIAVASYYYDEILSFINNLEEAPDFSAVYPLREMNEQEETGMINLVIEMDYHPQNRNR